MGLLELIKRKTTNINTITPLMNIYKYLKEEEITKLEEQLINIYNLNSSINYTNPSYVFPHKIILDKLEKYINTSKKYTRLFYYGILEYGKVQLLKNDIEKINEELSIHYNVLNKLEEKYPETNEIIEKEKNKIKETFQSNTIIIKELEKRLEKNKDSISENEFIKKELEFEKLKDQTNEFINKKEKLVDIEETDISKYKYIELVYKLEIFFNSKEGEEYISSTVKEMKNIERNFLDNDSYNPIPDINIMIKKIEFIDNYSLLWSRIYNEYKRVLKVKFEYLKKYLNEKETLNLKNDYSADTIYIELIENDLSKKNINNKIDEYFYSYISDYEGIDIMLYECPSPLTLFFAYYSDSLEEWFQNKMDNLEKFVNPRKNNNKVIVNLSEVSRETDLYFIGYESNLSKLINLHQELVKKSGLSWPILKGIKEIKLTDNESSKNILSLFSLSKNITVSKDVKLFAIENLKNIDSGNIIFQDGIEEINMRNVSFKDEITITIPKSVKYLDINFEKSNINTLIFEDYDQSNLLNNPYFINSIISQIYNEKSNCFTLNNCDYYVSPNSNKTIKLVLKRNNENKEYDFKQTYIFYNKLIHDFDNKELWKQDLIDTARKKVYDDITGEFHIKDRAKIITNISLNNLTNLSISLPEYGPFLEKNEEEIRLLSEIAGAKVLDLGCGEGKSLEYLYQKGAKEVWGIDQSEEIREKAKNRLQKITDNFHIYSINDDNLLPNNYFDYIISIYKIGYESDLKQLFQNVSKYLNDTGAFIISCPNLQNYYLEKMSDLVLNQIKYGPKNSNDIKKWIETINLEKQYYRVPTIINTARESNLYIDRAIEEKSIDDYPNTIIYKIKKYQNK